MHTTTQREYNLASQPKLAPPQPETTQIFDGYAAALWGTALGSVFTLSSAAVIAATNGVSQYGVIALCAVITLMTLPGCLLHLWYKRRYHIVTSARHFVNVLLMAAFLSAVMFILLPGVLIVGFLLVKFRSIREEGPVIGRELLKHVLPRDGKTAF